MALEALLFPGHMGGWRDSKIWSLVDSLIFFWCQKMWLRDPDALMIHDVTSVVEEQSLEPRLSRY